MHAVSTSWLVDFQERDRATERGELEAEVRQQSISKEDVRVGPDLEECSVDEPEVPCEVPVYPPFPLSW